MTSAILDPERLMRETRRLEERSFSDTSAKGWYRSSRKRRMRPFFTWPQFVVPGKCGEDIDDDFEEMRKPHDDVSERLAASLSRSDKEVEQEKLCSKLFAELPRVDVCEFERFVSSIDSSMSSKDLWIKVFAYTDFSALPVYAAFLALAATVNEKQLSARRVFAERCRFEWRSRGVTEAVLHYLNHRSKDASEAKQYIRAAHMVACLEEPAAIKGYLDAAAQFEEINDIRSALACVYRNVRHRLRCNQLAELDSEMKAFDV
ncbi:MAG: hypothetical protein MI861_18410, partial [Pirellulales bacterium]|nr:hypothetical protein [Pirellulales bacterium]